MNIQEQKRKKGKKVEVLRLSKIEQDLIQKKYKEINREIIERGGDLVTKPDMIHILIASCLKRLTVNEYGEIVVK